jgi:hypothetical protein
MWPNIDHWNPSQFFVLANGTHSKSKHPGPNRIKKVLYTRHRSRPLVCDSGSGVDVLLLELKNSMFDIGDCKVQFVFA